jgi:hypothetical protein
MRDHTKLRVFKLANESDAVTCEEFFVDTGKVLASLIRSLRKS